MTCSTGTKTLGQRDKRGKNAAQLAQWSASVPLSLKVICLSRIYDALYTKCKGKQLIKFNPKCD